MEVDGSSSEVGVSQRRTTVVFIFKSVFKTLLFYAQHATIEQR